MIQLCTGPLRGGGGGVSRGDVLGTMTINGELEEGGSGCFLLPWGPNILLAALVVCVNSYLYDNKERNDTRHQYYFYIYI